MTTTTPQLTIPVVIAADILPEMLRAACEGLPGHFRPVAWKAPSRAVLDFYTALIKHLEESYGCHIDGPARLVVHDVEEALAVYVRSTDGASTCWSKYLFDAIELFGQLQTEDSIRKQELVRLLIHICKVMIGSAECAEAASDRDSVQLLIPMCQAVIGEARGVITSAIRFVRAAQISLASPRGGMYLFGRAAHDASAEEEAIRIFMMKQLYKQAGVDTSA